VTVWRSGIKLALFVAVSLLLTVIVSNTVTRPLNHSTYSYTALFTDASGLRTGDDVDIAGVRVGRVTGERLSTPEDNVCNVDRQGVRQCAAHPNLALVSFEIDQTQHLTNNVHAVIRYQDLLGARFLSLVQKSPGAAPVKPGDAIVPPYTTPALSLTTLFNGFKPLFAALSPQDANQLATEVIADFQGEGGSITTLLHNVARLTTHLSNRDALIGQVIDNLNSVLGTVSTHRDDLATLITQLESLTSGLSADRHQIGRSLAGLDAVAKSVSNLAHQADPALHHDIGDLYLLTGTILDNQHKLQAAVRALPVGAAAFSRSLGYGSWLNGYVCGVAIKQGTLAIPVTVGSTTLHSAPCR
jgi:phospholipid/cholesterol/gamma-HCH transport system substrate-binding protein